MDNVAIERVGESMKFYQVDAFAEQAYSGNPAAICFPERAYTEDEMIQIAMEMNLSETAFLWKNDTGEAHYKLRWFTPEMEVELCGHATLASAHVLWEEGLVDKEASIYFETLSGQLIAKQNDGWIELDFPKGTLLPSEGDAALLKAFEASPINIMADDIAYVVEFDSEEYIRNYEPDLALLKQAKREEIIVTSRSIDATYDFVSRFFGPAIGVDEDPATGSAHCYLAPYWAEQLGRNTLVGLQVSKRSGVLKCHVSGDRVLIQGKATTILEGRFRV